MKRLLYFPLILSLSLFSLNVFAQSQIIGEVEDEGSQPLAFANILLLKANDSSLVKGTLTTEKGDFILKKVDAGTYRVKVSMIGYEDLFSTLIEVNAAQNPLNIGSLRLATSAVQLDEVEISTRKNLFVQEIDRTVVNVQSSISAAGGTVLDILEKSPGVTVDRGNGGISMAGKDGVIIMINGKQSRMPLDAAMQLLAGMSASNIEKLELITTPPANFDAEGNAGIINIVQIKSTRDGFSGSLSVNAGYAKGEKAGAGINFNYRKNKINLFGDYSFNHDNLWQRFTNQRIVTLQDIETESFIDSERDALQDNHNARLGLDISLSPKTVVGVLVSGYSNRWSMEALSTTETMENQALANKITMPNQEINHWTNLMGNVNLQHTFAEGKQLSLNVDHLYYNDENPTAYQISEMDNTGQLLSQRELRSGKTTPIQISVATADYTHTFGKKTKLESGIKGTRSRFTNDVYVENLVLDNWDPDMDFTQKFFLEEDIAAAYSSLSFEVDARTQVKAGLRYEYTQSNLRTEDIENIVDRKYGNFFPSVFLSRELVKDHRVNLSYARRITRPTFNDMSPFIIFLDPNTYFTGNAAIQPGISDGVKLDYVFKKYFFSIQYSHENSPISRFQTRVDSLTNSQSVGAENLDAANTLAVTLNFPIKVNDVWSMQNNLSGNLQQIKSSFAGPTVELTQKSFRANSTQTFSLSKDYTLEVSGMYMSPRLFGLNKSRAFGSVDMGIQKRLKNDNGNLRLAIRDIFWTSKFRGVLDIPEQNLYVNREFIFAPRIVQVSYTRTFGNKKIKASRKRTTASEEERRRVN